MDENLNIFTLAEKKRNKSYSETLKSYDNMI